MSDFNMTAEAVKVSPAVTVSGVSLCGYAIPDIIQLLTLVYIIAQLILIAPRLWRMIRGKGSSNRK